MRIVECTYFDLGNHNSVVDSGMNIYWGSPQKIAQIKTGFIQNEIIMNQEIEGSHGVPEFQVSSFRNEHEGNNFEKSNIF